MTAAITGTSRTSAAPDDPDSRLGRAFRRPVRRLTLFAASLALMALALIPGMAVGAQSAYPPNTVVSTYFDARYCGDGAVSVVTDSGGNLIDICTSTGIRIYPVYADYPTSAAYTVPVYANASYLGTAPLYANTSYAGNYTGTAYSNGAYVYRQYTDNSSNCPSGAVTQTAAGYFCTATGAPAFRVA